MPLLLIGRSVAKVDSGGFAIEGNGGIMVFDPVSIFDEFADLS